MGHVWTGWQWHGSPLPHYRFEPATGSRVTVVFTSGADADRPNLGYGADGRAAADADRRRLAVSLSTTPDRLVFMEQVHSSGVAVVGAAQAGAGLAARETALRGADALVTADDSVVLVGLSADCPLVALWDEAAGLCAVAHAGWRGLASGVIGSTVSELVALGARAGSLRAAIGAAIGECCYEVDADVAAKVLAAGRTDSAGAGEKQSGHHKGRPYGQQRTAGQACLGTTTVPHAGGTSAGGKVHLSLVGAALDQLALCGVDPSRVLPLGLCTQCHAEAFHSYRRDGATAGRQAMAIRLAKAAG